MAKMRKSFKDVKRLRNAIASAKRTATKAQNLGQDVVFTDIRTIKDFNDRKEFNKYLRSIEKFNKENRFIENKYGVVFNRNKIEKANKLIDKQNKQRKINQTSIFPTLIDAANLRIPNDPLNKSILKDFKETISTI